jgi:hypothetical protein
MIVSGIEGIEYYQLLNELETKLNKKGAFRKHKWRMTAPFLKNKLRNLKCADIIIL